MATSSSLPSPDSVIPIVKLAGEYLLVTAQNDLEGRKKNYGEVVSDEDTFIQAYLALGIKRIFPNDEIVGEEDLAGAFQKESFNVKLKLLDPNQLYVRQDDYPEGAETDLCGMSFPTATTGHQRQWVIDPIDGSNNYIKKKGPYAVVVYLKEGGTVVFAIAYQPADSRLFQAKLGDGLYMNGWKLQKMPPKLDTNKIKLCYGLGKRASQDLRNQFQSIIEKVDPKPERYGCLTWSFCQVCVTHRRDAYFSLKEEPYKAGAIDLMVREAGFCSSLTPDRLNQNGAFAMTITHPSIKLSAKTTRKIKSVLGPNALP